jgi:hypothetical protein
MQEIIVRNNEVNKDTLQDLYASKLQASFAKFVRSFTGSYTKVHIQRTSTAQMTSPAWSDDNKINLVHTTESGSVIAMDNLVRLKGLLIHELSHVLYTPRSRTVLAQWVRANNLWNAFNILEDNRIENMMVASMSGVTPWLTHAVTKELLSDHSSTSQALPLVWGRKYLSSQIRQRALVEWPHGDGRQMASVIDKYIKLNLADTKTNDEAKKLIREFSSLMQTSNKYLPNPNHGYDVSSAPDATTANTQTKSQQDKLLNQVDKIDKDNSDKSTDTDDAGEGSQSSLSDALQQASDQATDAVYQDVKLTIQGIRDVDSPTDVTLRYTDKSDRTAIKPVNPFWSKNESPHPDAVVASRKFARELNDLRAEHDPGWLRKTETGRLNVREYMLGGDIDEIFDQWTDGNQDVTDIECVILLDNSGSMSKLIDAAYNAMWSTKRALDSIGASTTVIQFGSYGEVLYPATQKAGPSIFTSRQGGGGGTDPFYSIRHAKEILDSSHRAIKIFLIITDGQWGAASACEQVILNMRMSGTLTGLVFLCEPGWEQRPWFHPQQNGKQIIDGHKCEVVHALDNPLEIVDVAKALTKLAQRKVLN